MTREQIALLIHWEYIVWGLTILNPCFMLPQLFKIWETRDTEAISTLTLWVLILIQGGFSLHGYFIRDAPLMLTNALASGTTVSVILSTFYMRARGK